MPHAPQTSLVAFLLAASLGSVTAAQGLDPALALVPEDAVGMVAIPSLNVLNIDLADLLERSGRSELVLAGRPIDLMASQIGFSAAFNDKGMFVAWWSGEGDDEMLAFAVPVADTTRFLVANLTRDETVAEDAWQWGSGELVYARDLGTHVLLSGNADLVRSYDAGAGLKPTLEADLGAKGLALLMDADVAIWVGRAGLAEMSKQGAVGAEAALEENEQEGFDRAFVQSVMDRMSMFGEGVDQVAVAIDVDALAMSIRTLARFDPASKLGKATVGGESVMRGGVLSHLPNQPYYAALGVDVQGLGGMDRFVEFAKLAAIEDLVLPGWISEMGASIRSVQFAAYPSKLGIAMGGVLNDSSLVIETADPAMAESLLEATIKGADGVEGMVRRTTSWTSNKELKGELVADVFTLKRTLRPKNERPEGSRSGDFAMQNLITGLFVGSRGLQGLAKTTDDALVVTFSRRPDVMNRAIDASGSGRGLSDDPVITSMRRWMLESPDLEVFLDVGRLGAVVGQMMKLVPGMGDMVMMFPEQMPPVGFSLAVEDSTLEMSLVVPSEVVGAAIGFGMQQIMQAP